MSQTTPPRNIIYFDSKANPTPLAGIAALPYTDVIVGFLVPEANLDLKGAGGAFNSELQSNIQTLQNADKNVLSLPTPHRHPIGIQGGTTHPTPRYGNK